MTSFKPGDKLLRKQTGNGGSSKMIGKDGHIFTFKSYYSNDPEACLTLEEFPGAHFWIKYFELYTPKEQTYDIF